jgi:hypothetical protein
MEKERTMELFKAILAAFGLFVLIIWLSANVKFDYGTDPHLYLNMMWTGPKK